MGRARDLANIVKDSGNFLVAGTNPNKHMSSDSDAGQLWITHNDAEASTGTSIGMWGRSDGTGFSGGIHYVADTRGSEGAHSFYQYNGATWARNMSITEGGQVLMPNQPGVCANQYSGNNSSSGTYRVMYFDTFLYNIGGHYNSSNGRFTCPVAGRYLVSITNGNARPVNNNQYVSLYVAQNGQTKALGWSRNAGYDRTAHASVILNANANDYFEFLFHNSYGEPPTGIGFTTFHIHLLA